jgi:hypothetical protein
MGRRKSGGVSIHEFDAWVKQGRPTDTFTYRGKTRQSPTIFGTMERGSTSSLYTPDQLEKLKEKIESAQEKNAVKLEALKAEARELWKKDESHAKELGQVLCAIRDKSLKRGDFKAWWTEEGFTQSRVSYCLRVAEDKIQPSKKKTKESKRFVVLSSIGKKLSDLYSAIETEASTETIEKLVEEIITDVQGLRLTVVPKEKKATKKKARAAGAGK